MSKADSPHTTTLTSFSSAGAVLARHAAVLPAPSSSPTTALAHQTPHHIVGYAADRFDVLERADHLKAVLAAVTTYTKAIVADTAYYSPVNVHDETGYLVDAASEVVGALNDACDRMLADQENAAE
jgi:hypothetical protein